MNDMFPILHVWRLEQRIEINREASCVGIFNEVCVPAPFVHLLCRFWPVNGIEIGGHVALLSSPTVYSLYCD